VDSRGLLWLVKGGVRIPVDGPGRHRPRDIRGMNAGWGSGVRGLAGPERTAAGPGDTRIPNLHTHSEQCITIRTPGGGNAFLRISVLPDHAGWLLELQGVDRACSLAPGAQTEGPRSYPQVGCEIGWGRQIPPSRDGPSLGRGRLNGWGRAPGWVQGASRDRGPRHLPLGVAHARGGL